ncbi:Aste57867_23542 [Aphanomyces stellatus]|uniref:Aste57867_23542 protein n=1 Tax=Aphanomyces stellatus TaxID=120398 RepID=A0A485LN59_9STRA|nr:hypothetical protein As57867_023471 [Aphanomyces stellatus]VFU00187.1 Aste57867_23542 [Aphanomyces stellatus]
MDVRLVLRVHIDRLAMIDKGNPQVQVPIQCDGVDTMALFDTGAMLTLMSTEHWDAIQRPTLKPMQRRLRGAGGEELMCWGSCETEIVFGQLQVKHVIAVCPGLGHECLLGMDFVLTHGISMLTLSDHIAFEWNVPTVLCAAVNHEDVQDNGTWVSNLVKAYAGIFAKRGEPVKQTHAFEHMVEVSGDPIKQTFYPLGPRKRAIMRHIVQEMVRDGLAVKVDDSKWATPAFLRPKGGSPDLNDVGAWRMVNDLRLVNQATKVVSSPLPRIDDILDRVAWSSVFTALDLASSFWQVRYGPGCAEQFSFVTEDGTYQPTGMLMGAVNSAGAMQTYITKTLGDYVGRFVEVYIDDILVHSNNEVEHEVHVNLVMARMAEYGWTLRQEKCEWNVRTIDYLGHVLEGGGVIRPKDKNIEKIIRTPKISTAAEAREFLGRAGYYRRFLPGFANAAAPLHHALKSDNWAMRDVELRAVDKIVNMINRMTQITAPAADVPLSLIIGADFTSIGCVLSRHLEGAEKPVAFAKVGGGYGGGDVTVNQQAAGLEAGLRAAKKAGSTTVVAFTDSELITKFVHKVYSPKDETLRKQMATIAKLLDEFDAWVVHHVPREFNKTADHVANTMMDKAIRETGANGITLRAPPPVAEVSAWTRVNNVVQPWHAVPAYQGSNITNSLSPAEIATMSTDDDPHATARLRRLREGQLGVEWMRTFIEYLEGAQDVRPPRANRSDVFHYTMVDGVLCKVVSELAYKRGRGHARPLIVVPPTLREIMIREAHAGNFEAHGGTRETYDKMKSVVCWPGMYADVAEFVKTCHACQAAKVPRHTIHAPSGRTPTGYAPMDVLAVDHADLPGNETALGNKYVLVVTDLFSRFLWCIPVRDRSATTTAFVLHDFIFAPFGTPRMMVSDRGGAFISKVSECLYNMFNVRHTPTTSYRPQANGVVERVNRVVKERLRALMASGDDWDEKLPAVTTSYNRSIHAATGYSPFYAFFLREPFTPTERMLRRGEDPQYRGVGDFVERLLPESVKVADEIRTAHEAALERGKTQVDGANAAWMRRGGTSAGNFDVGSRVWIAVPRKPTTKSGDTMGKLTCTWKGPLVVLSRKGESYRIGITTGGVLKSPVHANRLRPYYERGRSRPRPREDLDLSGVDWETHLIPLLNRNMKVENQYDNKRPIKRPIKILRCRRGRKLTSLGRKVIQWLVEYDNGTKGWINDQQLKPRHLVEQFSHEMHQEDDEMGNDAGVAVVA